MGPRVGLVGIGRWGRLILRDLVTLGCDVVAVTLSERSRDRALAGGAREAIADVGALETHAVDGVVVATPIRTHAEVIASLLPLGVPVFVEKPLTDDARSAREIASSEAAERVFVMDKWRYHPGVLELARIASAKELGRVIGLELDRVSWGTTHEGDADDLWVLAPHDLSIALEILGWLPEPRAARGWSNGRAAVLTALLGDVPWVALNVASTSISRRRRIAVHCEQGLAWLSDAADDHVGVARHGEVGTDAWEKRPVETTMPLLSELQAFVDHLGGGPPPRSSAAEGADVVATIEALRRLAGIDR